MKKMSILWVLILLLAPGLTEAQDCATTAQADLKTQRSAARHYPSGAIWTGFQEGRFVVDDPNLSSEPVPIGFSGGLWLGGKDAQGELKIIGNSYGISMGVGGWFPGPLDENGVTNDATCSNFDKIWEVKKENIDALRADFSDNGIIDNAVHPSLLEWPGKDNPHSMQSNGFELPLGRSLAPFVDQNNDGIYNPLDGDHPMRADATSMQWWMTNDYGMLGHQSTAGPFYVDVSFLAYHLDNSLDGTTTIFYEIEITNRGAEQINELLTGLWFDPDMGCPADDYSGCIPEKNLSISYNADAIDDGTEMFCDGVNTFDVAIPLMGIKILRGIDDNNGEDQGMHSYIQYYNNGVGGPFPQGTVDPTTAPEYYRYLQGTFRDGTPITFGETGYTPSSTDTTQYMYPDPPNQVGGWSMCDQQEQKGDVRQLLNLGPTQLEPNESVGVCFAAIVTGAVEYPCPDIAPLLDAADRAQGLYDGTISKTNNNFEKTSILISPNPADQFININLSEGELIQQLRLSSVNGQVVFDVEKINSNNYRLDRMDIANGIYFLTVVTESGKVGMEKVVFMK